MNKDVIVTIIGTERHEDQADVIRTSDKGLYYQKNNKHYLIFDHKDEDETQVTKNTIIFTHKEIDILKNGVSSSRMHFAPGETMETTVNTIAGPMNLMVKTYGYQQIVHEDGIDIHVNYDLTLSETYTSNHHIEIEVREG